MIDLPEFLFHKLRMGEVIHLSERGEKMKRSVARVDSAKIWMRLRKSVRRTEDPFCELAFFSSQERALDARVHDDFIISVRVSTCKPKNLHKDPDGFVGLVEFPKDGGIYLGTDELWVVGEIVGRLNGQIVGCLVRTSGPSASL